MGLAGAGGTATAGGAQGLAIVDAELSSVTTASDKLIRVDATPPYLAHAELQASADLSFDERVLVYNVLARRRHQMSVRSVGFLLRPEAASAGATGGVTDILDPDASLTFRYKLVRVWELPVDGVVSGGLGTLPLAPISLVREVELSSVIARMRQRLSTEVSPPEAGELWTATRILMGLRYSPVLIGQLLKGVQGMEESITYQEIISKGRAEGRAEGERAILIRLGTRKFGAPDARTCAALEALVDPVKLEDLALACSMPRTGTICSRQRGRRQLSVGLGTSPDAAENSAPHASLGE